MTPLGGMPFPREPNGLADNAPQRYDSEQHSTEREREREREREKERDKFHVLRNTITAYIQTRSPSPARPEYSFEFRYMEFHSSICKVRMLESNDEDSECYRVQLPQTEYHVSLLSALLQEPAPGLIAMATRKLVQVVRY